MSPCPACGHLPPDARAPLTPRQAEILGFLVDYISDHGYAPIYDEVAERFAYRSLSTVHEHLHELQRKGYLRIKREASRGITLIDVPRGIGHSGVALAEQVIAYGEDHLRDAQPVRLAGGPL